MRIREHAFDEDHDLSVGDGPAPLQTSPVDRAPASAGAPRAYVWSQFPDSPTGRAMRIDPTLSVAGTTSQVYQNAYIPPDHRFQTPAWPWPGASPVTPAQAAGLGIKMATEMMASAFYYGNLVGSGSEDWSQQGLDRAVDGMVWPMQLGNLSAPASPAHGWLDVAPVHGHPADAIAITHAAPGQLKAALDYSPHTETDVPRARFGPFIANAIGVSYALASACMGHYRATHRAYRPPGSSQEYDLCIPAGFVFDLEEQLDQRLAHQIAWVGGSEGFRRLSDIRDWFDDPRAGTEPILFGPAANGSPAEWTLNDWWRDIEARGVWLLGKALPNQTLGEPGSPLYALGREISMLGYKVQEYFLAKTWVRAYAEAFGRQPRWAQYRLGKIAPALGGDAADPLAVLDGQVRHPVAPINYIRAWVEDSKLYTDPTKVTDAQRVALLEDAIASFDRSAQTGRPSIGELPWPRDGSKPQANVGDEDTFFELFKCYWNHGIYEVVVWNDPTEASHNRDVEAFYRAWTRCAQWAREQAAATPSTPSGTGIGGWTVVRPGDAADDDPGAVTLTPQPQQPQRQRVMIDDGIVMGLFTTLLTKGLQELPGGRGGDILVEAFGTMPAETESSARRVVRIDTHTLRETSGTNSPGSTDRAMLDVTLACIADAGAAPNASAHACAEVASLVRAALRGRGIVHAPTTHTLNVGGFSRSYAMPDPDKEILVGIVTVSCLVSRDVGDSVQPQPAGEGGGEGGAP